MKRLVRVGSVLRVPVFVHWSVFVIAGLLLLTAFGNIPVALAAVFSYIGVILLHEVGHQMAARSLRCPVFRIELYAIHGFCVVDEPYDEFDHIKIAWGGVVAQAIVAIPLIVLSAIFGLTDIAALNAVIAIFGYFSFVMAVVNLVPVFGMDGEVAWRVLPRIRARLAAARRRKRSRKKFKVVGGQGT